MPKKLKPKDVYQEVIFLIGPVGAGKSLISSELGKRNNLPVITMDMMRHCPKSLEDILNELDKISNEIKKCETQLKSNPDKETKRKLNSLYNDKWICERRYEMRKLLPNLPNYEELGFNGEVSNFIRDKFGIVGWHFYQKQFENQMLQALTQQLDFACIVDMGGGMSISLDEEYSKLDKQFRQLDEDLYLKHFDLTKVGFAFIQESLSPFKNIVELQLPKDYSMFERASKDELNATFISSGQNHQLATMTVNVGDIIKDNHINWDGVAYICDKIETKTNFNNSEFLL